MIKILVFLFVTLLAYGFTGQANAAPADIGNGLIWDEDTNLMWLQNNPVAPMTFDGVAGAEYWAEELFFFGHDDWRLPTWMEFYNLTSVHDFGPNEIGLIEDPWSDIPNIPAWTSTPTGNEATALAYGAQLDGLGELVYFQEAVPTSYYLSAFAVRGPVVPVPSAIWLLGSGLIGLVGIRRKVRNG